MTTLLPHLFELSERALEALQTADKVLAPLEQREDELGSIEGGLARVHIRRAVSHLLEVLTELVLTTGVGVSQVDVEARH